MNASLPTSQADFEREFSRRNVPRTFERLKRSTVGILGAGGLGTHASDALVRAGVGRLVLADPDRVEISNLNRQLFFLDQVGRLKVEALAENLRRINPFLRVETHPVRITPANLSEIFGGCDILVEALDAAEEKAKLIEAWLLERPPTPIVAASGLGGIGAARRLKLQRIGRLVLCGDGETDAVVGLCAPRVGAVANLEANAAVALLLKEEP